MPFDLDRLAIAGTPARVVDDVHQIPGYGLTFYSLSDTGTLSYLPSRAPASLRDGRCPGSIAPGARVLSRCRAMTTTTTPVLSS